MCIRDRGGPLKALASREETAAPARPAADPGADEASLFEGFVGDCEAAVGDKRLIDEVVARFAYSGALQFEHETTTRYDGQGAVKRGLSRLFFEGDAARFDWAGVRTHAGEDRTVSARLTATAESGAVAAELDVAAAFDDAGGVASLFVSPLDAPSRAWLARTVEGVQVGQDGGPKWETYDGRVRQQIWQSPDCFAPGNPFLAEKLELTTGRLVTIVDETVWGLYREKMEAWAASVDLVLDPIIAPGNEDEKSMENMIFMLDEIARVDPLRRAEPILAVGGGVLGYSAGQWTNFRDAGSRRHLVPVDGEAWTPRCSPACAAYGDRFVVLFGGSAVPSDISDAARDLNDVVVFDVAAPRAPAWRAENRECLQITGIGGDRDGLLTIERCNRMGAAVETLHKFEWHEMSVSGARATFDQLAKAEAGDGWLELRRGPLIELTTQWRVRTPTPAARNAASLTSLTTIGGEEALVLFGGGVYPDTYYNDTHILHLEDPVSYTHLTLPTILLV